MTAPQRWPGDKQDQGLKLPNNALVKAIAAIEFAGEVTALCETERECANPNGPWGCVRDVDRMFGYISRRNRFPKNVWRYWSE